MLLRQQSWMRGMDVSIGGGAPICVFHNFPSTSVQGRGGYEAIRVIKLGRPYDQA